MDSVDLKGRLYDVYILRNYSTAVHGHWRCKVATNSTLFIATQLIRSLHPVFHAYGKKGSPCKVTDITSPKTHHCSLVALVRRHYATTGPNLNPNLVDPTFPPTSKRCYKRRSIVRYTQIYAISNTLFKITANEKRWPASLVRLQSPVRTKWTIQT